MALLKSKKSSKPTTKKTPAASPKASVSQSKDSGKSWAEKYSDNHVKIEALLWGWRAPLLRSNLTAVKDAIKSGGPDAVADLVWLKPDGGKNQLVKELHELMKA